MSALQLVLGPLHLAAILGAVAAVVLLGRFAARQARQPEVIGEITAGLLIGPAILGLLGARGFHCVLPPQLLASLKTISQVGLVFFTVGLAHKLWRGSDRPVGRTTAWVAVGSFLPALTAGFLLASWVLHTSGQAVRGDAPTPAFMLLIAICLAVTAVPVLARILIDSQMVETEPGRVSLSAAIALDAVSWLALAVAVGLRSGRFSQLLTSLGALAAGTLAAFAIRRLLSIPTVERLAHRTALGAVTLIATMAIGMAQAMEHTHMTAILGAVLTGLAIPNGPSTPWDAAVAPVMCIGRALVPVFFVVSGITVLTKAFETMPLMLILVTTLLGIASKACGGYLGARLGGQGHWNALRVGALMNCRGLTEMIVLQVGYNAGILTTQLYLAFVVMALVTTVLTSPSLQMIDRAEMYRRPAPVPPPSP